MIIFKELSVCTARAIVFVADFDIIVVAFVIVFATVATTVVIIVAVVAAVIAAVAVSDSGNSIALILVVDNIIAGVSVCICCCCSYCC